MKKALIISLYGKFNYGNKLQNFAVKELLKENDIEGEVLRYKLPGYVNSKKSITLAKVVSKVKKKFRPLIVGKEYVAKREQNFDKFNQNIKYTSELETNFDMENLKKYDKAYDYNFIGSDQVWGLKSSKRPQLAFALFSDKNKNIAIAASFGVDNIPNEFLENYKKGLINVKYKSIREEAGCKLVKNITNEDAVLVCDQTMAIDISVWDKISAKPEGLTNKPFILCYFVESTNSSRRKKIKQLAETKGYEVISLNDTHDKKAYSYGPSEFIYLIKNAKLIITDSFHCSLFSILYKKNFYVLDRVDSGHTTGSRIDTLLAKFDITSRKVMDVPMDIQEIKYINSEKIVEEEKKKIREFLKKAISEA